MVLLAAAVTTKAGKPLVSRQFVEMTRARVEGLLAAFPKLMGTGQKQHTFVETESVRYVYQPMDQLYMLLITTKASNILEDLETLRLFSRVIPEYCRTMEEKEILDNAFNLIFAFDEIVALGYRENVNLAQIRTFTEMESHEEKIYLEIKKSQERDAKEKAKEKARQLASERRDAAKRGIRPPTMGGMGNSSGGGFGPSATRNDSAAGGGDVPEYKPSYQAPSKPSGPNKAMKLGGKQKDVDSFVDQLKSEGQEIISPAKKAAGAAPNAVSSASVPGLKMESVHVRCEEKLTIALNRNGGVENFEINGVMSLKVTDAQYRTVKVKVDNHTDGEEKWRGIQLQTHPNLDKDAFRQSSVLQLKNAQKPLPIGNEVSVLKWRFQSSKEDANIPFSINCWPEDSGQGCDVNIEYTLENEDLELNDVVITIPLPAGMTPVVSECEGEYKHDRPKNQLEWRIAAVDSSTKSGTLAFTTPSGHSGDFFPVRVNFSSKNLLCEIVPTELTMMETEKPVKYSTESVMFTEKYEIS